MPKAPFAVVTGGGTGGHVSPALAVAEALVEKGHRRDEILLVGSRRGVETTLVPAAGFRLVALPGRGIKRSLSLDNLAAVTGLLVASAVAFLKASFSRPRVVVTVGGYAGFAYGLAAVVLRIPLVVVTVDAVPGAVNRLLGRFATANAVALAACGLPRAEVTGAPIRRGVEQAKRGKEARRLAFSRLGLSSSRHLVVVTGGSLGAGSVNRATLEMATALSSRRDIAIYHVAGKRNLAEVEKKAAALGLSEREDGLWYRPSAFETELAGLLAGCDLAICRAGALTLAELTALGVPSVLVPLPGAPGDHQTHNAALLERAGAAVLLKDAECEGAKLTEVVTALLSEPEALQAMEKAAASLGRRDGAELIAAIVEQAARGERR